MDSLELTDKSVVEARGATTYCYYLPGSTTMKETRRTFKCPTFGKTQTTIGPDESGRLTMSLEFLGKPVFMASPLGITVDGMDLGAGVTLGEPQMGAVGNTYPWRGNHSVAVDQCVTIQLPVLHLKSNTAYSLEIRLYDDGVAYRYVVPGAGARQVRGEATSWQLPSGAAVWYQTNVNNYEGIHERRGAAKAPTDVLLGPPLTIELPGEHGYAAITEGGVFNYSGMVLQHKGKGYYAATFNHDPNGWTMYETIRSPWRIVMVSSDLNGLVNSDIVHNVCPPAPPALRDAAWIRPGKCVWSWWSWWDGKSAFYLPYEVERERRFIEQAAALGFEYTLIDAGWENWSDGDKDKWALMRELVDYAAARGVGVWVWRHYGVLLDPEERHDFLSKLKAVGVVGLKVDFMDAASKYIVDFYTDMLKETAAQQLMINFHGANKPTGESRTWPNEMTREGIYGLEQNLLRQIPPHHNASLPFTRFLAGHGDYTPGALNPEKLKGTTVTHQLATGVVFLSPVTHWAENPARYIESGLRELISSMPTVWDETRVLPMSKIGELAVFARRSGDLWFVGVVNGDDAKTITLPLDFLDSGSYYADVVTDNERAAEAYVRGGREVTASTTLKQKLAPGGGMVLRIKRR